MVGVSATLLGLGARLDRDSPQHVWRLRGVGGLHTQRPCASSAASRSPAAVAASPLSRVTPRLESAHRTSMAMMSRVDGDGVLSHDDQRQARPPPCDDRERATDALHPTWYRASPHGRSSSNLPNAPRHRVGRAR